MITNNFPTKGMGFIIGPPCGYADRVVRLYIFGMLATIISKQFFPRGFGHFGLAEYAGHICCGFIVRAILAHWFLPPGDLIGRKIHLPSHPDTHGWLHLAIGLVPGFKTIGWAAPIIVLVLRLVQGLALEVNMAALPTAYVAEHAPANRRGFWTSWIQTTATSVISLTGHHHPHQAKPGRWKIHDRMGWMALPILDIPVAGHRFRDHPMRMSESPCLLKVKAEGKTSKNPLKRKFWTPLPISKWYCLLYLEPLWARGWSGTWSVLCSLSLKTCVRSILWIPGISSWSRSYLPPRSLWCLVRWATRWAESGSCCWGCCLEYFHTGLFIRFPGTDQSRPTGRKLVDASKTVAAEPITSVDAKDKKKMLVTVKYDTAYTDGAVYTYTKNRYASTWYRSTRAKTASIAVIRPNKENPSILDTPP